MYICEVKEMVDASFSLRDVFKMLFPVTSSVRPRLALMLAVADWGAEIARVSRLKRATQNA